MAFRLLLPCLSFSIICSCSKQPTETDQDRLIIKANAALEQEVYELGYGLEDRVIRNIYDQYGKKSSKFQDLSELLQFNILNGGIKYLSNQTPEEQLDSLIYESTLFVYSGAYIDKALHSLEANRLLCGDEISRAEASLLLTMFQYDAYEEIKHGLRDENYYNGYSRHSFTRHHTIIIEYPIKFNSYSTRYRSDLIYDKNKNIPISVKWNGKQLSATQYSVITTEMPILIEVEIQDGYIESDNHLSIEMRFKDPFTQSDFYMSTYAYIPKDEFNGH